MALLLGLMCRPAQSCGKDACRWRGAMVRTSLRPGPALDEGEATLNYAMQACSILYKSRLPLVLVFNKVDVARHEFALDWMRDYDTLHAAVEHDVTYAATLSRWVMRASGVTCPTTAGHMSGQTHMCRRIHGPQGRSKTLKRL